MAPEAAEAMAQCLTMDGVFANPASLQHEFGERANAAMALNLKTYGKRSLMRVGRLTVSS